MTKLFYLDEPAKVNEFLSNERFRSGAHRKFTLFKVNVKEIAYLIKEARSVQERFILNNRYFSVFYQVSYLAWKLQHIASLNLTKNWFIADKTNRLKYFNG